MKQLSDVYIFNPGLCLYEQTNTYPALKRVDSNNSKNKEYISCFLKAETAIIMLSTLVS